MEKIIFESYKKGVIDAIRLYRSKIWKEVPPPLNCEQLRNIDQVARDTEEELINDYCKRGE